MPVRNSSRFLRQAIDSALGQNYPNKEIIVVDGLSTDGTIEILKSYGPRIRWISEADSGPSDAANKGIDLAEGDLVTFLNADDFYASPSIFTEAAEQFSKDNRLDYLCANLQLIDEETSQPVKVIKSNPKKIAWRMSVELPGSFFKRKLFFDKKFDLSLKIANDHDMICYLIEAKKIKYQYVDKVHVIFRLGGLCNTVTHLYRVSHERFKVRRKYYGLAWALPFYLVGIATATARNLNFRPFFWWRRLRSRLMLRATN